jgi:hypothetical protein
VARTPGIADAIHAVAPALVVEEVDVVGPPTSARVRAAGWAEASVLLSAAAVAGGERVVGAGEDSADAAVAVSPHGAWASASIGSGGAIHVRVAAGPPLDDVVLRSYCVGAAHQALSWVTSEGIAVGADGTVHDLTIRSFGILRARDTPPVSVELVPPGEPPPGRDVPAPVEPVNGSDAVFAAVAAASWIARGLPPAWPTDRMRSA